MEHDTLSQETKGRTKARPFLHSDMDRSKT
jgi:hypothetical protein